VPESEPGDPGERVKDQRGSATAWAFHLQEEIGLWKRLYFTPGLRLEVVETRLEERLNDVADVKNSDVVPIPGGGVWFQATDWLGLLAGVHRGFSPVAPGQPDDVEPELSVNYEAGARLRGGATHGEVIGFFNDYSNLTGTCTQASGCAASETDQQFNAGEVWVYGVEAVAGHALRLPGAVKLSLDLAYTLTLSEYRSPFDSPQSDRRVETGDSLAYVPGHQGTGTLATAAQRWGVSLQASYIGEMRDVPGQGDVPTEERVESHLVLDLAAHVAVSEQGRLYAKADNLLDTAYVASRRPFGLRPGKPLQVWVGYKHAFGE